MSWRFALRPKWIVRHVLVVILCAVMIALGLWQLERLGDKRAYRDLLEARQALPTADVAGVVAVDASTETIDRVLFRSVGAVGTYAADDTFVVENRTLNGASGGWVLTPLVLADGSAVVVNRGFIGFDRAGAIVPPVPPDGPVAIEGLVVPSQERGRFGPTDPGTGTLTVLARVDLGRFAAQVSYPVLPAYIQLVSSDPVEPAPESGDPGLVALGVPEPDLGPHLAYAGQWLIFTLIAGGGYVLLLRKVASEVAREERLNPL